MSERIPVFAANWKMNTSLPEGVALCGELRDRLANELSVEIVICPPFTHLASLRACVEGSAIVLGAQNMYWETKGAFTGEISAGMLTGLASHVILGHSERRQYFGETDADVNRKLKAALAAGLTPIVCVGETGAQRNANETEQVLARQVQGALDGIDVNGQLIVAYEPVWAIGTGVSAHGQQAEAAIARIRALIGGLAGDVADTIRILYGGSVTPANIAEFMAEPDVDGALVGGASLSADSFTQIVELGSAAAKQAGR